MKNVVCYIGQEFIDYTDSLWTTDEFKAASKNPNTSLYKTIREVCAQGPYFFYEMSDPVERTQFSSWWRHTQVRHYSNPAINDVYYYHELFHVRKMRLYENSAKAWAPKFEQWVIDVNQNELMASLESEVYVYLDMPSLREKTFNHKIWADTFIDMLRTDTIENVKFKALKERLRILQYPNLDDPIEAGIFKYGEQNRVWATYWKSIYTSINFHVHNFSKHRKLSDFRKFLEGHADREGILFRRPTEHFHNFTKDSILTLFKAPT